MKFNLAGELLSVLITISSKIRKIQSKKIPINTMSFSNKATVTAFIIPTSENLY